MDQTEKGFVYVTRKITFSSAHRLHHPELDNEDIFGACSNLHGHNYTAEVTVRGRVGDKTGFVIDLKHLKYLLEEKIKKVLDHKNLDCDVEYFKNTVQSAENIAIFIWEQLEKNLPQDASLYRIRLHETNNNMVEYFGGER